jgi:hypothetical protein
VIESLANADWGRWKSSPVSRQKKDALFELSCRIALIAEKARAEDNAGIAAAAATERRKLLAFGLDLLAEGADAEALDQAYELDPVFHDLDAGTKLELALVRKGLASVAAREHPFTSLRRMTALLGPEYFDKASAWMSVRIRRRKRRSQALLVPGELPDVIRRLAAEGPASLDRALRAGGRDLAAAALAGCPQESLNLAAASFGAIGGTILGDDADYLRGKLSSDEIIQAQSAFLEILHGLTEEGEVELADEELYGDPNFVAALTKSVIAVDEKALKASLKGVDARLLAMSMQGMEPRAHDRILGLLSKKEERRVLDAIDAMILLPRREIEDAGRSFARGLIAVLERAGMAKGDIASRLAKIRDWPEGEARKGRKSQEQKA